ncbi:hypothetical protein PVK06_034550 [Gossypium arboreum]|uniref:Uncharacterized protein n=1 Tax=Gossypium arboreum TaxID=29729 RepID=A0ABR0NEG8_GOSAR|nr:hypothetical protein PVK06_034550 [Gossypium arboreum]
MSRSKLFRKGMKIKCHNCSMVEHNSRSYQTSTTVSIPSLAGVPSAAPALPAHSQIVAFEASASSPPTPSTQPTPPIMPTSSTQKILTRLRSRGK